MTKTIKSIGRYRPLLFLIAVLLLSISAQSAPYVRVTSSFDSEWRFLRGDAPGAEKPDFDDSAWRKLDLPHDWSIEGPFDEKNPTGGAGGFLPAGVGWYRKHFSLPIGFQDQRVFTVMFAWSLRMQFISSTRARSSARHKCRVSKPRCACKAK